MINKAAILGSRKLLELIALGEAPIEILLLQKFLPRMAALISLTIVGAMLTGSLLIGGLFISYSAMIEEGFEMAEAALITAGIAVSLLAIIVAAIITTLKRVFSLGLPSGKSIVNRVKNIGQAFFDGLSSEVR